MTKARLRGGVQNVLIFWPNLRLEVLIALVLVKRKPSRCCIIPYTKYTLFFISTSAISTARLRIGQKISTFCAPPLRLAFVKYQFSKYGYFMIYCKKEIIHL